MKGDDIAARLVQVATGVIKLVDTLPDTPAARHVAGQLLRSGTSPGANYGEARGAESRRDFLHKLGIALKEIQETRYWLSVVVGAEMQRGEGLQALRAEVNELSRIIGASMRTASSKRDSV